jgi:hypothetical protein
VLVAQLYSMVNPLLMPFFRALSEAYNQDATRRSTRKAILWIVCSGFANLALIATLSIFIVLVSLACFSIPLLILEFNVPFVKLFIIIIIIIVIGIIGITNNIFIDVIAATKLDALVFDIFIRGIPTVPINRGLFSCLCSFTTLGFKTKN